MSEHEFWNELGNLYFLTGAYEPAIHAYARSIETDNDFGRPYSNMALAYVQTGKYLDAIEMYHRSIQLLNDDMEKAVTWNRLGILYRLVKDYHSAVIAYEQADKLDPHQDDKREEAARHAKFPLHLSMPNIDLAALLKTKLEVESTVETKEEAKEIPPHESVTEVDPLSETESTAETVAEVEVNAELEEAEEVIQTIQWYDGDFVPPNPISEEEPEFSMPDVSMLESEIPAEELSAEGWILLNPETEEPVKDVHDFAAVWGREFVKALNSNESLEIEVEAVEGSTPVFENQTEAAQTYHEEEPREINTELMQVTEQEPVQYMQTVYPLVGLSDEEVYAIESDIARYRRMLAINSRNGFAWDTLGDLYKKLGRFKQAIIAYQKAITIESHRAAYHYKLGLVYSISGRDEEAVDAFDRALALEPGHTFANASLANQYRKMGFHDLAEKHIEAALNGAQDENEYNQACLESLCGNTDRAFELLQIAMEDKPSNISWAQVDPDLAPLRNDERFPLLVQSFAKVLEEE